LSERLAPLTFVVHKHRARRLHYDLRLEWDGTMPSWAVPRGPSTRPADRHLAVHVEDHPLSYATFEGLIPAGQYGAGEVIVWDNGTYSPDEDGALSFHDPAEAAARMRDGLAAGKLSVTFRGRKLKGSYALVRTRPPEGSTQEHWLLLKHRDAFADPARDLTAEDRSVRSGLSIADLQAGRLPDPALPPLLSAAQPAGLPGARFAPFPLDLAPMQAEQGDGPFVDSRWLFEPKLDGIRALAFLRAAPGTPPALELRSRRGLDMAAQYPQLARELVQQPAATLLLDGEIVALDPRGVPSFELLQQRLGLSGPTEIARADAAIPVVYYVFDLLYLDGIVLRAVPLSDRRETLARVLAPLPHVRLVEQFPADGVTAYRAVTALGLEGLVAKRADSAYEPGRRSRAWLKLKSRQSDDFVIAGFTAGAGGRARSFGALLLGTHDRAGHLHFAGQVGSGFDDRALGAIRAQLDALAAPGSPFAELPPDYNPAAVTFVRPELVCEVAFAHWTREGRLRAPVFLRMRPDKPPHQAVRSAAALEASGEPHTHSASDSPSLPAGERGLEGEGSAEHHALAATIASALAQLASPRKALTLELGPHRIALTNLDKPLWPAHDAAPPVTKRDLIVYYAQVAPWLLPHLRDRPLTMTRYPNGITAPSFYQKHYDDAPAFVDRVRVHSETGGGDQTYLLCNNLPTLLWLGQMADIALHSSLARTRPEPDGQALGTTFSGSRANLEASLLNYPDFLLFDLDPYIYAGTEAPGDEPELNRRAYAQTCEVARWLRELLASASLEAFVKTSGATGLHVYVPVVRQYDYATIRSICETVAGFLTRAHPAAVTTEWQVPKRAGKVFLDHNQNARFKSLACAYSPRAKPGAPVSMPLAWDELERWYPTDWTVRTVPARLAAAGDAWARILDAKHDLDALIAPAR
jgi:bifunctional non-homologous end joining protein LigD